MLYQLVYSSSPEKKMMKSHLYIILRLARMKNKLSNLTGMLVFVENMFFQVLEGEQADVKAVFERIKVDPRHKDIEILLERNIDTRTFSDWEMAYASPSTSDLAAWSGFHNTTTIQDIMSKIKDDVVLVENILMKSIGHLSGDQNLGFKP